MDALEFSIWEMLLELVRKAFEEDPWAFRAAINLRQFVVLSQRFRVASATS